MKLEIRHLAPYLAHGLKVRYASRLGNIKKEAELTMSDFTWMFRQKYFKPILHPLSEVMDINSPLLNSINTDLKIQMEICDLANKKIGYWDVSYGSIEVMCENHIDFFGLIDAGLATDINTLKN